MVQGPIRSPVYIAVEKGLVAVSPYLHGEVYIPVKANQMVKKPLQILCSVGSKGKE
jgi:hypothetical protein